MRFETAANATNLIDVRPTYGNLNLNDAYRVKSGAKASSVLWERMRRLDGTRMPPLASSLVDSEVNLLIGQWIDQLTGGAPNAPSAPQGLRIGVQ